MDEKPEYDWEALKAEYFLAETMSVSEFLKQKQSGHKDGTKLAPNPNNNATKRNTKGWREEKERMRESITNEIIEEFKNTTKADMLKSLDDVRSTARAMAAAYRKKAVEEGMALLINPKIFKDLWHMMRTECDLPTSVSKSEIVPPPMDEDDIMNQLYQDADTPEDIAGSDSPEAAREEEIHDGSEAEA